LNLDFQNANIGNSEEIQQNFADYSCNEIYFAKRSWWFSGAIFVKGKVLLLKVTKKRHYADEPNFP